MIRARTLGGISGVPTPGPSDNYGVQITILSNTTPNDHIPVESLAYGESYTIIYSPTHPSTSLISMRASVSRWPLAIPVTEKMGVTGYGSSHVFSTLNSNWMAIDSKIALHKQLE